MGSLSIIRHTQMRGIRSGRLSNNPYKFLGCSHCRTSCDDPDTNTKKIFPIKPKYVPAFENYASLKTTIKSIKNKKKYNNT